MQKLQDLASFSGSSPANHMGGAWEGGCTAGNLWIQLFSVSDEILGLDFDTKCICLWIRKDSRVELRRILWKVVVLLLKFRMGTM